MLEEMIAGLHFGNFYLNKAKPDDTALIYRDFTQTFYEMDTTIRQYCAHFTAAGLKKGDIVALSCYNTPEYIYSYMAITQIGAIVVPLNLMLTMEEISFILKDSGAQALIVHEKILARLKTDSARIQTSLGLSHVFVLQNELAEAVSKQKPAKPIDLNPDDICTLLYTSGTTGKPKGVMLSHTNLMANTVSCSITLNLIGETNIFMCVLPMFHTFGFTTSVLLPLYTGSPIVIHDAFQPKEVMASLVKHRVSVFCGVPAMYVVLAQALRDGKVEFPDLRLAVSGGAPMPVEILNLFNKQYEIPLVEGYGLTEAAPVVSLNPLVGEKKPGSIGKPLYGVEVKIGTPGELALPSGEVGELLIKGLNVMKGYLGLPEETAEALKGGWLHTGDMAYRDEEGYLFIVDRKKDMIITRGLNVYPREIEELLYVHPDILEAAVVGIPDPLKGEIVKAFVVPKEGAELDRRTVLDYLKPKLASYKMPRLVEFIAELPKSATGKILKKELRAVSADDMEKDKED
ncbi:long-chain fatty acid--CoA ligase [Aneurinibacillus sp. Ricciae_BoGa-3]|uniref:long-chain-fatty-acid--CoA ligase n=1 Tax=Aneurinibacillus sp. Ricciae_BoGa-3 TaxID=3022697 RepID=UPI0023419C29|nr:long-chain fatty acid--CoA ligase [Aneurinibacillus sp. Ricciae_BoGa-3]WCK55896.1 long-chain fatty acid--CoA ligase [Aneurinibacillus sp. Ricciae_BoGa-3]